MNATQEQWRPVVGYEGLYEVSDHGRVRSLDRDIEDSRGATRRIRGRMMTPTPPTPPDNYLSVMFSRGGKQKRVRVHVVVLEAFVGPRPVGMEGCHNNGDAFNNHVENLRWDTKVANAQDSLAAGTNRNASKTHCKRGHEFTPRNTYIIPSSSGRVCRTCVRNSRGTKVIRV